MKIKDITIIEENGKRRIIKGIIWKNMLGGITITLKNKITTTKTSNAERQSIALEGILKVLIEKFGDKE